MKKKKSFNVGEFQQGITDVYLVLYLKKEAKTLLSVNVNNIRFT
jgi:hypothetical protein